MFPAPSPNSQAIFNSMQGGLATPGTLDFQRTAMNVAARSKGENSNPHNQPMGPTPQGINKQDYQPAQQAQMGHQDPFSHPDRDAVNSLYMLAHTGNRNANQFAVPNQPPPPSNMPQAQRSGGPQNDTSPTIGRGAKQSMGSVDSSMAGFDDKGDYGSDGSMDQKPPVRAKGGKKAAANKSTPINGRRKAEDSAGKGPANKRAKSNSAHSMDMGDMGDMGPDDSDDDMNNDMELNANGKKMTDEEKRKNFLERNR